MQEKDINKYIKILNILVNLANIEKQDYAMKVYKTSELQSITTDITDRTLTKEKSNVWVIAEKSILKKIDEWGHINENGEPINDDQYHPYFYQNELTYSLLNGHSVIIMTDHSDEYQVLPKKWEIPVNIKETIFKTQPMISNIYCYTYNDELGKAVKNLKTYFKINNMINQTNNKTL